MSHQRREDFTRHKFTFPPNQRARLREQFAAGSFIIEPEDFLEDALPHNARGRAWLYVGPTVAPDQLVQRRLRALSMAIQELSERWNIEGCEAFDTADTPAKVAEAVGMLRCALELSQLLDTLEPEMRTKPVEPKELNSADPVFPWERRTGRSERRRQTRTDRRTRS